MPILDVEIVVSDTERLDTNLAASLAGAVADVFGSPAGQTWVRLRVLPMLNYAENGGGPPEGTQPIFVTVLKAKHPTRAELEDEIDRLTEKIANICKRPAENVHVLYEPQGSGRIAFGGKLVSES